MAKPTTKEAVQTQAPTQQELFAPTTTLATVQPAGEVAVVAEYEPTGLEFMTNIGLAIPELKLLQGISKELNDDPDLRRGMYYHTVEKQGFAPPVRIVPVHLRERAVVYRPELDGTGIITQSSNGVTWDNPNTEYKARFNKLAPNDYTTFRTEKYVNKSKLLEFGQSIAADPQSKPIATKQIEVIVLLPDFPHLNACVFTFRKSAYKIGNDFRSWFASQSPQIPIYSCFWKMGMRVMEKGQNQWVVPTIVKDGLTDGEIRARAKQTCAQFHRMALDNQIVVDVGADEEVAF